MTLTATLVEIVLFAASPFFYIAGIFIFFIWVVTLNVSEASDDATR